MPASETHVQRDMFNTLCEHVASATSDCVKAIDTIKAMDSESDAAYYLDRVAESLMDIFHLLRTAHMQLDDVPQSTLRDA